MQRVNPKEQFSKWLAKSGAIFWIVYLLILSAVMAIQPEVAMACVYLAIVVSVVMIFHVWAYTKNSTYEKGVLAFLDKTRMELTLGGKTSGGESEEEGDNG